MNNRILKAYIKDKFGIKVKNTGYGYIMLEQEALGTDGYWKLHTDKVYMSLSKIVDALEAELAENNKTKE